MKLPTKRPERQDINSCIYNPKEFRRENQNMRSKTDKGWVYILIVILILLTYLYQENKDFQSVIRALL